MKTLGLFTGIGGIELGLRRAGHDCGRFCEIDPGARAVLERWFPGIPIEPDIRLVDDPGSDVELLAGGFPCQDISQAGMTAGIDGRNSGLIGEVFRLLHRRRVPWVLLENVPFMLQLGRGKAMEVITAAFRKLGYAWAYRIVDTLAFGLPQRRRRVYLVASIAGDPRTVLFADDAASAMPTDWRGRACGFYWTEGTRGLGWAIDSTPTLKGGSTIGVPSPPAIWMPNGSIVTPDVRDAERLQGFEPDWTLPAADVVRDSFRWKLVGNAVSVPVAAWLGHRLSGPGTPKLDASGRRAKGTRWPNAAASRADGGVDVYELGEFPAWEPMPSLSKFLAFPTRPLSQRATSGFVSRLRRSGLEYPREFLEALESHRSHAPAAPRGRPVRASIASRPRRTRDSKS